MKTVPTNSQATSNKALDILVVHLPGRLQVSVISPKNVMPPRSSATLCSVVLLIAVGFQARDYGGKLSEHLRPTELGPAKRLFAPWLGDVEARMLEEEARAFAVWFQPVILSVAGAFAVCAKFRPLASHGTP
jgi:hypothetical protein